MLSIEEAYTGILDPGLIQEIQKNALLKNFPRR